MKKQVFVWMGFLFILSACDKYTERDVLAPGNQAKASTKTRDLATFGVKAPKSEDIVSESREAAAKSQNQSTPLVCDRIEQAIELPALTDPCVLDVDQVLEGKYILRRFDLEVKQAKTKETLRFSRESKEAGRFQTEDIMRRDVLWGASNEVTADLNFSWSLWKTSAGIKFDNRINHRVVFDRLKETVVSKTLEGSNDRGARMYELVLQAPIRDAKSKASHKLLSGTVNHSNAIIFEPDTDHAVRVELDPIVIKGQAIVRKLGTDASKVQLIVIYQLMGDNSLNYTFGVAHEYELVEKMASFKGSEKP